MTDQEATSLCEQAACPDHRREKRMPGYYCLAPNCTELREEGCQYCAHHLHRAPTIIIETLAGTTKRLSEDEAAAFLAQFDES